jgi:O-acetyl-ADP-ribose deacetylase (regulator of RNase III)
VRTASLAITAPAVQGPAPIAPPARIEPLPQPISAPRIVSMPATGEPLADPTLVSGDREVVTPELRVGSGKVRLLLGNILRAGTEALVAPTDGLLGGSGAVNRAIREAAGPEIEDELRQIGSCTAGAAIVTGAGRIPAPAKLLLHTVGPNYTLLGEAESAILLRRAHAECLRLAEEKGMESVAFPALSVECNGYPLGKGADIAFSAAVAHLLEHGRSVTLIVFALSSLAELMAFTAALGASASALPARAHT